MNRESGPIFIVGPTRSGTELLRAMLNQHPDIHIVEETHYFDDLRPRFGGSKALAAETRTRVAAYFAALANGRYGSRRARSYDDAPSQPWTGETTADEVFEAFCNEHAAQEGKTIWGEKTPRHVFRGADLLAAFPDARIIGTVRDPKAVVASYRDWRRQPVEGESDDAERVRLESCRIRNSYSLTVSALMWCAAVQAAEHLQRRFGAERVRLLRYEALVSEPHSTLSDLCAWLEIDFAPQMLDVAVVNSTYLPEGKAGIQSSAVDRWRRLLNPDEVGYVQWLTWRIAKRHGYRLDAVNLSLPFLIREISAMPFQVVRAYLANRHRIGAAPQFLLARLSGIVGNLPLWRT